MSYSQKTISTNFNESKNCYHREKKQEWKKKHQMNKRHRTRKTKRHKKIKTAALHYKNCVAHFPRPSAELPSPSEASAVTAFVGKTSDHTVKPVKVSPKAPVPPAFRVKPSAGESLRLVFLFFFHGGQRSHCASVNANLASRAGDVPAANTQTRFGAEMVEAISM